MAFGNTRRYERAKLSRRAVAPRTVSAFGICRGCALASAWRLLGHGVEHVYELVIPAPLLAAHRNAAAIAPRAIPSRLDRASVASIFLPRSVLRCKALHALHNGFTEARIHHPSRNHAPKSVRISSSSTADPSTGLPSTPGLAVLKMSISG